MVLAAMAVAAAPLLLPALFLESRRFFFRNPNGPSESPHLNSSGGNFFF